MSAVLQLDQQPKKGRMRRVSQEFAISVVSWFRCNGRDFPWRDTPSVSVWLRVRGDCPWASPPPLLWFTS